MSYLDKRINPKTSLNVKIIYIIVFLILFLLVIFMLGKENIWIFFSFIYNVIIVKIFGFASLGL